MTVQLSLSVDDSARAVGVSRDTFERKVLPEIRSVLIGRRRVVAVKELERWLERNASRPLEAELRRVAS